MLDYLVYVEDTELTFRNNQGRYEINPYGRNLLNMCINTGLRIVNSDSNVGTFTCITDRSASTIDYMLVDEFFTKCITYLQVGDSLESIYMPLILDFQYDFDSDEDFNRIDQTEPSTHTVYPQNLFGI